MEERVHLQQRYQSMWDAAVPEICRGAVDIDATLALGQPDVRRGLTVVARPGPAIQEAVLRNPEALVRCAEEFRTFQFGVAQIRELSLVKNDWYLSTETLEVLHTYPLRHRNVRPA